ncbi:hypothetical protein L9F63_023798, partial [Diploptera punctata]
NLPMYDILHRGLKHICGRDHKTPNKPNKLFATSIAHHRQVAVVTLDLKLPDDSPECASGILKGWPSYMNLNVLLKHYLFQVLYALLCPKRLQRVVELPDTFHMMYVECMGYRIRITPMCFICQNLLVSTQPL